VVDPQFRMVSALHALFPRAPVSPLINPGAGPAAAATDLLGRSRDGSPDIGAYEVVPVKGDFDANALTDLVLAHTVQPNLQIWRMEGPTRLEAGAAFALGGNLLAGVDRFAPGAASHLALRNVATGAVTFQQVDSTTLQPTGAPFALVPLGSPAPLTWTLAATADLNGDARADLVWRDSATQALTIWTLNGAVQTGTLVPTPAQAIDANWSLVGVLDYNGDGDNDFLWYNATSGKIVFWFMNVTPSSVTRLSGQFANPSSAGNNNWKVVAGGDFGEGGATGVAGANDIVWRNQTSGKLVLWFMDHAGNRTTGLFTNPDSASPALDWTVAGPR